jgi:hypothetical protein
MFGFETFWQKDIGKKRARNMLVKLLTPGEFVRVDLSDDVYRYRNEWKNYVNHYEFVTCDVI